MIVPSKLFGNKNGGRTTKIIPEIKIVPKNVLYNLSLLPKNIEENIMANNGLLYIRVRASPIGMADTAAKHKIITIPAQKP